MRRGGYTSARPRRPSHALASVVRSKADYRRMARYDRGVKFDYPSQNDGFLSHVARRGAEKTATGVAWFLLILVALMILGGIESGSPFFITIAVLGGLALLGKVLPDPKEKLSSEPSATPAAPAEAPETPWWLKSRRPTDRQTG